MHWAFNRFSDLSYDGAMYTALAYTAAALAVIVATRGSLGWREPHCQVGGGPGRRAES